MSESLPENPKKPNRPNQGDIEHLTRLFRGMMVTENPFNTVCANVGIEDIKSLTGKRVLDVAAGLSNFGVVARKQGIDVTSMDIGYLNVLDLYARSISTRQKYHGPESEATIEDIIKNPSNYIGGNALQMPIKDESFDVVVCSSFLTSEPGMEPTLVELVVSEGYRVLKPGGKMYVGMNILLTEGGGVVFEAREIERNIINAAKKGPDGCSIKVIEPGGNPWVHAYVITK